MKYWVEYYPEKDGYHAVSLKVTGKCIAKYMNEHNHIKTDTEILCTLTAAHNIFFDKELAKNRLHFSAIKNFIMHSGYAWAREKVHKSMTYDAFIYHVGIPFYN